MERRKFKTVNEFIDSFEGETHAALKKLRQLIKQSIPKAEEVISYNIPCYKIDGKYLIYFAGYAKHVSVYPIPKKYPISFQKEIDKYKAGKGTLKFQLDKPLPVEFIQKVINYHLKDRH
jgi:uncharacterized protein YdhG (YjbR/CyaY superfamily)